jgi:hypothetical protein
MMQTDSENKFKNPVLPKEFQDSGLKHKGGTNFATETFLHVNYKGVPVHSIDPEVYLNDIASYWRLKERPLWIVVSVCFLFLAMKLLGS